jgi:diadenosine tetraphosphate (Ap4A) HIT family hydrolase
VLENNEALAHQAVPHVHFHIIPKPDESSGLGIGWPAGKLDPVKGAELAFGIAKELARG